MWFAERPLLQVALLEDRLVVDGPRRDGGAGTDPKPLPLAGAGADEPLWRPAMARLAGWLREESLPRARLHIHLSSRFVRWQLLEWQPQLTQPQELEAYVRLRFRATFGAAADGWRVMHAEPMPGRAVPACAIDEALVAELQALRSIGDARVVRIAPYFSAAFDRWCARLGRQTAWFGAAEPGSFTLGLLHKGAWRGLRSMRHPDAADGGWRGVLPAMQAQIALASGLALPQDTPVFLAGCGAIPGRRDAPGLVWLAPEGRHEPAQGLARMAWGI